MKGLLCVLMLSAAAHGAETNAATARIAELETNVGHMESRLSRQLNELLWSQRLSDIAVVDKARFPGLPPVHASAATADITSNAVIISALTFLPRKASRWSKLPLIVLAHGEIHGNTATDEEAHVVRELIEQGYAVIAPDYRGSSGYGAEFWRQIDYGGREIEDAHAARAWMLERHPQIDANRVGIIGWSHGGAIALMTVFSHPESYRACYAGVPVSDLELRVPMRGKGFEQLFAAPYHLGKTLDQDPQEYRRRSPASNAAKLQVPLLIHANTADEDVTEQEVHKLVEALRRSGKAFQYHIYTNAPGGHYFNRLDTALAAESRDEIWRFLEKKLSPPRKLKR